MNLMADPRQDPSESAWLRAVLDTVIDGLIIIDEAGIICAFNPAAERIFGYRPHEVIGVNVKKLMPEPYCREHDQYLRNYRDTGIAKVIGIGREVSAVRKDGTIFPIELGVSEMRLTEGRMFVGTVRDISERKDKEANQAWLQNLLNTIVDGLMTIDETGVILSANPAAERLFGYTKAEMLGHNVKMLMPEPYHSEHDGYIRNYRETGRAKIIGIGGREVIARRKDGSTFPMELGVSEMTMYGKRIFAGIIRDITERKRAESTTSLLATIVSSSEDAIISKTLEGEITSWNVGAEQLFGYSSDEAIGQNVLILIPPHLRDEELSIIAEVREGRPVKHYETIRQAKNGRQISIALSVSPIRDVYDTVVGASTIAHDISSRKKAEGQLRRHTAALERSNQDLDDFAYIASHDLKEPLRGLANQALFLNEDHGESLDAKGRERLDRIVFLCNRMERLVDDLLYFSRLGRQELALQHTDLNGVVESIRSTLDAASDEGDIIIDVPKPLPKVFCDKPRITELFRNLIGNAFKYNQSDVKRVEIGVADIRPSKSGASAETTFYVRDNGIGIAPEFHNEVFRIFKRLNQEDDAVRGTGVGLTFVKKIVERHHGRIWVESEPGSGSTFFFTLNSTEEDRTR